MTNEEIFKAGLALMEKLVSMEARILANDTSQSLLSVLQLEERMVNFVSWCMDTGYTAFLDKYIETHDKSKEFLYTLKSINYGSTKEN